MAEDAPKLTVQAIERAINPTTGLHKVGVRVTVSQSGRPDVEWMAWIEPEDDFAAAEEKVRKEELHRLSSAAQAQPPKPSQESPGQMRERKYRENQSRGRTGWEA